MLSTSAASLPAGMDACLPCTWLYRPVGRLFQSWHPSSYFTNLHALHLCHGAYNIAVHVLSPHEYRENTALADGAPLFLGGAALESKVIADNGARTNKEEDGKKFTEHASRYDEMT